MSINFNADDVRNLVSQTSESMMRCKRALLVSDGDKEKAAFILQNRTLDKMEREFLSIQTNSEDSLPSYETNMKEILFGGNIDHLRETLIEISNGKHGVSFDEISGSIREALRVFDMVEKTRSSSLKRKL